MSDTLTYRCALKPVWDIIGDIRAQVRNFFNQQAMPFDEDIIEDTLMCITELIENAVKYGTKQKENSDITVTLKVNQKMINIAVENKSDSESHIHNLKQTISKIHNTANISQLYVDRLMQILENPLSGVCELGLIRIAYEGPFTLEYSYNENTKIIKLIASKQI